MTGAHRQPCQPLLHQHGLSLVEILVALTISLFLTSGVIQLFIGTKQTYRFSDGLSRLQENGRFAIDRIAFDIRMAGFRKDFALMPTDTIKVEAVDEDGDSLKDSKVTVRYYDKGNDTNLSVSYFINTGTSGRLALFRKENALAAQEIVEGIEKMQVTTVPCVGGSAGKVCSARVSLLLVSSERNLATEPQTVVFPPGTGTTFTAPDRRLPQIFSTTVAIRNRPF